MDEHAWQTSLDPIRMLTFLRGKASRRQLRLFSAACCRHPAVWPRNPRLQQCVEVVERLADGLADEEEMNRGVAAALKEKVTGGREDPWAAANNWALAARCKEEWSVPRWVRFLFGARTPTRQEQAGLLRDIFNPFRSPLPVELSLLQRNEVPVRRLAEAAYEERGLPRGTLDPQRLAVLADALEEAGCDIRSSFIAAGREQFTFAAVGRLISCSANREGRP